MARLLQKTSFAAVFSLAVALVMPAHARPPTVTSSPGYDRALQQSRKEYREAQPTQPVQPALPPQKKTTHHARTPKNDTRP